MTKFALLGLALCAICFNQSHAAAIRDTYLDDLQRKWAVIKYQEKDKNQRSHDIAALADQAAQISQQHAGKAEPLIWQAIILSTQAEISGGLDALHEAEQARDLLLQAEKIDPLSMRGIVYTCLGVLYDRVPAWPVGFGDKDLARTYLAKGVALDPDGLDSNYFYGAFLYDSGEYAEAKTMLEKALASSAGGENPIARDGRRNKTRQLLAKME